jgi:hypothetical protein
MEFDSKAIFSILVALIMIGSIVGFTAFYNFPDQEQNSGGDQQPVQPPTSLDFVADDVNAIVFQMLPSMKISGETGETDIARINSRIYAIEGVKRLSSKFEQSQYTMLGTGFVYSAEISFSSDLNIPAMLERIESATSLKYIEGYTFALIELPKSIEMKSKEAALGLSKNYAFSEDITEAFVNFGTMEGDLLNVSVSATFIGDEATNILAYENENLTARPIQGKAVLEAEVASLENRLLFSAEITRSGLGAAEKLEQDANAINGVLATDFSIPSIAPKIYIEGQGGLPEDGFARLEQALQDLNADSVSIENNPVAVTVSFSESLDSQAFLEKKQAIEALIPFIALDFAALVKEETGTLSGQLSLEGSASSQAASSLSKILAPVAQEFEIFQPGKVLAEEIFDQGTNTAYEVPNGEIQALLLPGHAIGSGATVEAEYEIARGKISSSFATEKKP